MQSSMGHKFLYGDQSNVQVIHVQFTCKKDEINTKQVIIFSIIHSLLILATYKHTLWITVAEILL